MNRAIQRFAVGLAIGQLALSPPVFAEERDAGSAANPANEEAERDKRKAEARAEDLKEVLAELKRSSDFLAAQKSFRLDSHLGFDVVQSNGQKLEFGGLRKITVRRPDRVKVEAESRDGTTTTLFFDGEVISIDLADENAYVSVEKPGSLDSAIDYLVDDLGVPAPFADLIYSDFFSGIVDRIESGFIVGESAIGKCECLHLAFSLENIDVQMWIEDSDRPLPYRVVITYKQAEGSPQFWGQFLNWDLSADTPDSLFAYSPPEGAELIPIAVAAREAREASEARTTTEGE
jgi:hypothetical protein